MQMLSVERTKPFISELALPIEDDSFFNVMRLARACLEVFMFRPISSENGISDSPNLLQAWQSYQMTEGVLSNETLYDYVERYKKLSNEEWANYITQTIYMELPEWIGLNAADLLKEWFVKHYQPSKELFANWPRVFRLLLRDLQEGINLTTSFPIADAEKRWIEEFCNSYYSRRVNLMRRFEIINKAAKTNTPTLWESVLQTFPAGGCAGNFYPWLISVEQCLAFKIICNEWNKLREKLGANKMKRLTDWVRREASLLPSKPNIPDEPN
jgi:hypothetical protein